jgi:hypothetical protein
MALLVFAFSLVYFFNVNNILHIRLLLICLVGQLQLNPYSSKFSLVLASVWKAHSKFQKKMELEIGHKLAKTWIRTIEIIKTLFGYSVAMSNDGRILAVGIPCFQSRFSRGVVCTYALSKVLGILGRWLYFGNRCTTICSVNVDGQV